MEDLNNMSKIAQEKLWLRGFRVSSRVRVDLVITSLQYAYDTLVFCVVNRKQLRILRVIFVQFEALMSSHQFEQDFLV